MVAAMRSETKCPHCGSYINIREVASRCTECGKELFNSNKENMKSVFKDGDTVYHYQHGEGIFKQCQTSLEYTVYFLKGYSSEPALIGTGIYDLLSFTPYRFQGFTQERPFKPEIGKFYWFWDDGYLERGVVVYGKLISIGEHSLYSYKIDDRAYYQNISDKNPLECQ
jgi:DNA-directed RNA polymerase subunit RPC12/RpoP